VRYIIVSDIHSNLEALQAVFKDIGKVSPSDKIVCLGDVVGYGPNPNECVEFIAERTSFTIMGNHDHALLGLTDLEYFNPYAAYALLWTQDVLSDQNRKILETYQISVRENHILFVHATPKDPLNWDYISTPADAIYHLKDMTEPISFIGHSHIPVYYALDGKNRLIEERKDAFTLQIRNGFRYIINVGSVGQPRDRNPSAAYAIYDLDKKRVEVRRVPYDIQTTQQKMRKVNLPVFLIERLSRGI
jgi:diadenosine tetraphosphatase ApaH/serine/threonine PP2A family protein phosphatase